MFSSHLTAWGIPRRAAIALAAGVAMAHLVALDVVGKAAEQSRTVINKPFITRTIALSRTDADAAPAPPVAQAAQAAQRPVARPKLPVQPVQSAESQSSLPSIAVQVANLPVEPEPVDVATPPKELEVAPATGPVPAASATQASAKPLVTPETLPVSVPANVPVSTVALTLPGSLRMKYNAEGLKDNLTYRARAEILWQHDGSNYEARMEVSAFLVGARVRTSTGKIGSEGLLPIRFADKFRSEQAAHFERDKNKVTFSANTPDVPLQAGLQDQLSVLFQLAAMLGGAPAKFPAGAEFVFETIGPRAPETWVIRVNGEELLNLPGGQKASLKVTRAPRREYDQTTELWLAPEFGYLPVRIKITDKNGDFVDQQWRSSEPP